MEGWGGKEGVKEVGGMTGTKEYADTITDYY